MVSKAPKEREPVATGEAQRSPWDRRRKDHSPRRSDGTSVKNISFLERNFVGSKKRQEFLSKRFDSMMFFLLQDVVPNELHLRLAHGENAVTFLPRESLHAGKRLVNPFRRISLEVSNQRGDRFVSSPSEQNVNVIGNAADGENCSSFVSDDSSQVIVNPVSNVGLQPWLPMFGAENKVQLEIVKCPRHDGRLFRRPVGAEQEFSIGFHGFRCASPVATGWRSFGAVRCKKQFSFNPNPA